MKNKKQKIFIATLPSIFGYGISSVGFTKSSAMRTLRKSFDRMCQRHPQNLLSKETFDSLYEKFGGSCFQIKPGEFYYENFLK